MSMRTCSTARLPWRKNSGLAGGKDMNINFLFRRFAVAVITFTLSIPAFCGDIHDAAEQGDLAKIKQLLSRNAKLISSKDDGGRSPLHLAAGGRHKDVVEFLIANNVDINAKDQNGDTPLHWAAA